MKTLYLDCGMGAAGDMIAGALLELVPDPKTVIDKLNGLGVPGLEISMAVSEKCGVTGTHFNVLVNGREEVCEDYHGAEHAVHDYSHDHEHAHSHVSEIYEIIDKLNISESVRANAKEVYALIADAESKVHGESVDKIHLHEVGAMDAIADIVSVCMLIEELSPEKIISSPLCLGYGKFRCAHGIMPVPGPATAEIIKDMPVYAGHIEGELCTPTGTAIIRHFADEFSEMPLMKIEKTGYGMGSKDFEAANCIRAFLGETDSGNNTVTKFECTIDDMTPEDYAYATRKIMEGGALDVYTTPVMMKKGRPGYEMVVLADNQDRDKIAQLIFKYTTTIGMREMQMNRLVLNREEKLADTEFGPIRYKTSEGYGITRTKIEHDDLERIAGETGKTLKEVRNIIIKMVK